MAGTRTVRLGLCATVVLVLSGCATQAVSVHRLPPETPAADNEAAVKRAQDVAAAMAAAAARGAGGPASGATTSATATPPASPAVSSAEPPLTPEEAPSMYSWDPLERVNRFTYRFNARFDEHVFLPVANGYRRLPGAIRAGVHNFFHNLAEAPSTANYILQLRLKGGARAVTRFVVNTTLGIGGLFDVASRFRLSDEQTGFAATLSTWGTPPGPYLVIPLLGPSTLRDGVGLLGDYGIDYGINVANLYRGYQSYALGSLNAVDQRSRIDFRYYGSASPFEYDTIRFLYVHRDLIQDEALRKVRRRKPPNTEKPAGK
jgi:phospholipid-binding lipoprotein MlaA